MKIVAKLWINTAETEQKTDRNNPFLRYKTEISLSLSYTQIKG